VALAAIKGDRTVNELASQYGVHPTMIHGWKKLLLESVEDVFAKGGGAKVVASEAEVQREKAELYEQIGRLKMELEWLKKKVTPFG
jgi:transposase-like protein